MTSILILCLLGLGAALFVLLKSRRKALYRDMTKLPGSVTDPLSGWSMEALPADAFAHHLASVDRLLPEALWRRIVAEAEKLAAPERSFLPAHKKGGTVAYETLWQQAPAIVSVYRSETLRRALSALVGVPLEPTPAHDQSSCSLLVYERPGDHIGWHYDHNFYRGRHFTVLIPIANRGSGDQGLSSARLQVKRGRCAVDVPSRPNSLIVFEGAKVLHKVTPLGSGERRVVLSMTYASDPRNAAWQGIARRIKDISFFGLRALWT